MNYLNLFKAIVFSFVGVLVVLGLSYCIIAYAFYALIATLGTLAGMMIFIVYSELNDR
jgi:hypothetical protein